VASAAAGGSPLPVVPPAQEAELTVVLRHLVLGAVLRGSPWRNFGGAAVGPAAAALARCWGQQARVGEGQVQVVRG